MWNKVLGWLLGLNDVEVLRIEGGGLAAYWAQGSGLFWVCFAAACLVVLAFLFYWKFQNRGTPATRTALAVCRALLLVLLFITLADPFIKLYDETRTQPLLYVLFDGTESMDIEDELNEEQQAALAAAVGMDDKAAKQKHARLDYVKALVTKPEDNLLEKIQKDKEYRVEAFVFDGVNTSNLRRLSLAKTGDEFDPKHLAEQLSATGQVTAIGTVIDELGQQLGKGNLAGVVMFSDYADNAGGAMLGDEIEGRASPLARLDVPIYTVGVGATEAIDMSVDVRPDVKMKRAERSNVSVKWSQTGLEGKTVKVNVTGRWLEGTEAGKMIDIGEKTITLDDHVGAVDLPFTPQEAGRIEFAAEVEVQDGETADDNNKSSREVNVVDDHLRLMYVAYEPDWEWRFVKEVFHRDKLVGIKGFRTYLRSADPKVREYNDLFLPTMTPKRSEFFETDIIFLGDMPASAISQRFAEMTREFVSEFGGGLVVLAGPRFGPGELAGTPIADMLPVEVDNGASIRDQREFSMQLTPEGQATDFMRLGSPESDSENMVAWRNMGELQWYQPVRKPRPLADVLAEHPTDVCVDGKTRQPIIAIQRYGKGEVVYIAHNEMWRLRRKYGERYYRQFWSQIMNRLALSHALGNQKRFVVRTDRDKYNIDDQVNVIIEAYDENFERLKPEKLTDGKLIGELYSPTDSSSARPITLTSVRDGEFEARIAADQPGEWRVRVKDPIEEDFREIRFRVASLSAERRSAQRDEVTQQNIARLSGGNTYDLTNVSNLVNDLQLKPQLKVSHQVKPLWATPLWFIAVVGLMLVEWFTRKMLNMA